jgi:hypothetical protein
MTFAMRVSSNIAFKEWAVVVDALGSGEQILILRKGGIREQRGEFHVEHNSFWLFPTQYHEAERSIIPSKRPRLRELAAPATADSVDIQFYATIETVKHITDPTALHRLQGRHIWAEHVLQERFEFGREPGLHVLIARVFRLDNPQRIPVRASYGGCKSWIQLEHTIAGAAAPVLGDAEFSKQRDALGELLDHHALAYS